MYLTQSVNDDFESVIITLGQLIKYWSNDGSIATGKVQNVNAVTGFLTILTGDIIQYIEHIHIDDTIEG